MWFGSLYDAISTNPTAINAFKKEREVAGINIKL